MPVKPTAIPPGSGSTPDGATSLSPGLRVSRFPDPPRLEAPGSPRWARILSDGRYRVLLTPSGVGFSSVSDTALTPVGADARIGSPGSDVYFREPETGVLWSLGHPEEPSPLWNSTWEPGRFSTSTVAQEVALTQEICVVPDGGVEIRRLSLRNLAQRRRSLEITSCVGVALNAPSAHSSHPAFSKLFLETELAAPEQCLLVRRRPRDPQERHPWMFHALLGTRLYGFETDRERFWGRGFGTTAPRALLEPDPLSGRVGYVLDPILSLRARLELEGGEEGRITFLVGAAPDRVSALARVHDFDSEAAVAGGFSAARDRAGADLERLGLSPGAAEYLQALAAAVLGGHPALRPSAESSEGFALARRRISLRSVSLRDVPGSCSVPPVRGESSCSRICKRLAGTGTRSRSRSRPSPSSPRTLRLTSPVGAGPVLLRSEHVPPRLVEILDRGARLVLRDGFPDLASFAARVAVLEVTSSPTRSDRTPSTGETPEEAAAPGESLTYWNGFGGFSARWERVRDSGVLTGGPHLGPPPTVDERRGQRAVRIPRERIGGREYVGGE